MSVHHVKAVSFAAFAAACFAATTARADDAAAGSDLDAAVQSTIFRGDPVSNAYDDAQKWKKDEGVPISVGAWHWWHMNRNTPHDLHYGTPELGGTYYWYVKFDPELEGGATRMGAHVDLRLRDGDESFRPFFKSRVWLWEAYVWADICDMRAKAGKIWRRFGLDGAGSWYGNIPYFDGWKLDPDWGASLEGTTDVSQWTGHGIKAPWFLQVFGYEDRVNGSIGSDEAGADAESDPKSRERWSVNGRIVPTWEMGDNGKLELGLSWQAGQIDSHNGVYDDHTVTAGAVDLTWSRGPWKVFGESMHSVGARNPVNYVTGGPSDRSRDWLVGAAYKWQFATFRATVSHGNYTGPSGKQLMYLLGVTMAVTKNVDFYVEWVRWDAAATGVTGGRSYVDDSINFVLNWNF
jgi:hypothetical protein